MASIEDVFLRARVLRPYYGRGLSALTPIERPGMGTMAVDSSWRIYYDPEQIDKWGLEYSATIVCAHELEHLLRDHCNRSKLCGNNPAWNIAADAEINDDLKSSKLPKDHVRPSNLPWGPKPDGLMAEEYLPPSDWNGSIPNGTCGGGSGAGTPREDELSPSNADGLSQSESEKIRENVANDIKEYIKSNGVGSVPAGLQVWANAVLPPEPPIDWRRILSQKIRTSVGLISNGRRDFSWSRQSRRGLSLGIILPKSVGYTPHIGIVVDTSGSVHDGGVSISTVEQIVKKSGCKTTIWCCDTEAKLVNGKNYIGGGGTDMRVGISEAMKQKNDAIIVITDGETPWPESCKLPVIAVIVGKSNEKLPDWIYEVRP